MAKAAFFVNDLKVRKKDDQYLVVEARKMCQHGTVFDEVFLTIPAEWAPLFTYIEQAQNDSAKTLAERFKRFSNEN